MLRVLPFVQVDNLGVISSKERATPRDISVAFLAYLDLQDPLEQMVPLGPMVASAFRDEMGETAGKERKVKRGLQVSEVKLDHWAWLERKETKEKLGRKDPWAPRGRKEK